jgi:hypothetical protein
MDSIEQLTNAFAKVILAYYNLRMDKLNKESAKKNINLFLEQENTSGGLREIIKTVSLEYKSREDHLYYLLKAYIALEGLMSSPESFTPSTRESLIAETSKLVQCLHDLNHSPSERSVEFSRETYKLNTTMAWYGMGYLGQYAGPGDFGQCVRDYLLVPIGATGTSREHAKSIADDKVRYFFKAFFAKLSHQDEQVRRSLTPEPYLDGHSSDEDVLPRASSEPSLSNLDTAVGSTTTTVSPSIGFFAPPPKCKKELPPKLDKEPSDAATDSNDGRERGFLSLISDYLS